LSETPRYSTLRDYLRVLREQRRLVLLITAVFIGGTLLFSATREKQYAAETSLSIRDPSEDAGITGGAAGTPTVLPTVRSAVNAELVTQPDVIARVNRSLGTNFKPSTLRSAVETRVETTTNLVVIEATAADAAFSARLANAFAREFRRAVTDAQRRRYAAAATTFQRRLTAIRRRTGEQRRPFEFNDQDLPRQIMAQQVARLEALASLAEPVEITEVAETPTSPSSPKTVRNTLLGALVGLTIALLVAFGRDSLDRRIRRPREAQDQLELPLLTQVREDALGRAGLPVNGRGALEEEDLEAVRIMRTNLAFLGDQDEALRSVLVTSALPEEGKTTVAAALAWVSATAGRRTLLLECDLRRGDLAQRLSANPAPGLTDYLAGQAEAGTIFQPIDIGTPRVTANGGNGATTALGALTLVSAGSLPGGGDVLGSERFRDFLAVTERSYDLVVIDSSPLLPVVDTLELVPRVDGIVLCVRLGRTTREQASGAQQALHRFPRKPTGLVVTGVKPGADEAYGYSYAYAHEPA
jgi:receptor protein-tyrosine kinase